MTEAVNPGPKPSTKAGTHRTRPRIQMQGRQHTPEPYHYSPILLTSARALDTIKKEAVRHQHHVATVKPGSCEI